MTTCVYYDVEEVSAEELASVRASIDDLDLVEVAPSSTGWPSQPGAEPERLRASVDPDYQAEVMTWLDQVILELDRTGSPLIRCSVSLLEVARYRILDALSVWDHRWRSACEITRRWPDAKVVWVVRSFGRDRRRFAALEAAFHLPLRLIALEETSARHAALDLVGRVRAEAYWRREHWKPGLRGSRNGPLPTDTVLFAEYFPNSVHAVLPIARMLSQELGVSVAWLAGRSKVADLMRSSGVGTVFNLERGRSLRGFVESELTHAESTRLKRALSTLPDVLLAGSSSRVARALFLEVLVSAFLEHVRPASHLVEAMDVVLRDLSPRALVSTTYSSPFGRAAAQIAKKLGIKTYYVQHGVLPVRSHYYAHFQSDQLLVWGEYERRALAEAGHAGVSVTGATIYGALCMQAHAAPPTFSSDRVRIALLASRSGGMFASRGVSRRTIRCVADAVRRLRSSGLSLDLMVKAHPGDTTGIPEGTLRDYPEFEIYREGTSQQLIAQSDVVVITSSTTGNEACLLGRPLVTLNLSGARDLTEFVRYGAAVGVTREEDFEPALRKICTDASLRSQLASGRRSMIDDMLHGGRGDAARVAAHVISSGSARS